MAKSKKGFEALVILNIPGGVKAYIHSRDHTESLPINVSGDCENYSNQFSILSCKIHPFKITLPHQKVRNQPKSDICCLI